MHIGNDLAEFVQKSYTSRRLLDEDAASIKWILFPAH
jgi:hypothetical protein